MKETKCKQCKKKMNPVEAMMGDICGSCARENHRKLKREIVGTLLTNSHRK